MKHLLPLLFLSFTVALLISCGSDDTGADDSIIGTWSGELNQPDFGNLTTRLSITNDNVNSASGNGSFNTTDLSNCDDTQFVCSPLSCQFDLKLTSKSGDNYIVDQIINVSNNTCGDGIFEITMTSANSIRVVWYEESFPDNRATGTLQRN